ncbi:MAG: hypothetical protein ACI92I_000861 [Acidimicrobiales bacterium]|jgi:hypothetical protein
MPHYRWPKGVFVCKKFWADIEKFSGRNPKLCRQTEEAEDDLSRLGAILLTDAIFNVLSDPENHDHGVLHGKQPFLDHDLNLYKLRYAIDKQGKRNGIRVMYVKNDDTIIFIHAYSKRPTPPNGVKIDTEIIGRLKEFLEI